MRLLPAGSRLILPAGRVRATLLASPDATASGRGTARRAFGRHYGLR